MAETQNQAVWLKSKILITSLDSSQDVCMCNYTNELEGNMQLFGILEKFESVHTMFKISLNGCVKGQVQNLVNKNLHPNILKTLKLQPPALPI